MFLGRFAKEKCVDKIRVILNEVKMVGLHDEFISCKAFHSRQMLVLKNYVKFYSLTIGYACDAKKAVRWKFKTALIVLGIV